MKTAKLLIILCVFLATFLVGGIALALDAPALTVTVTGQTLSLSWTSVAGATGYTLYYAPYPKADPIGNIPMGEKTSMSASLPVGSSYYVALQAHNSAGSSGYSNIEYFIIDSRVSGWWDLFIPSLDSDKIDAMYLTQDDTNLTGTTIQLETITGTIVDDAVQLLFQHNSNAMPFSGTLTGDKITGVFDSTMPVYIKTSTFHISNFVPGEKLPSSNPQFAWTHNSAANKYSINVEGHCGETGSCTRIWSMDNITNTEIIYNSDNTASEALIPGNIYQVRINAYSNESIIDTTKYVTFGVSDS